MPAELVRHAQSVAAAHPRATEIEFPEGLPAFEEYNRFTLIEDERYLPFRWLQSLLEPAVGFLVIPPTDLVPDYGPHLADQDLSCLELAEEDDPYLLCILVRHRDTGLVTANLKAPVVVNLRRQRAKQIILTEERYPLRHPVECIATPTGGQTTAADPELGGS